MSQHQLSKEYPIKQLIYKSQSRLQYPNEKTLNPPHQYQFFNSSPKYYSKVRAQYQKNLMANKQVLTQQHQLKNKRQKYYQHDEWVPLKVIKNDIKKDQIRSSSAKPFILIDEQNYQQQQKQLYQQKKKKQSQFFPQDCDDSLKNSNIYTNQNEKYQEDLYNLQQQQCDVNGKQLRIDKFLPLDVEQNQEKIIRNKELLSEILNKDAMQALEAIESDKSELGREQQQINKGQNILLGQSKRQAYFNQKPKQQIMYNRVNTEPAIYSQEKSQYSSNNNNNIASSSSNRQRKKSLKQQIEEQIQQLKIKQNQSTQQTRFKKSATTLDLQRTMNQAYEKSMHSISNVNVSSSTHSQSNINAINANSGQKIRNKNKSDDKQVTFQSDINNVNESIKEKTQKSSRVEQILAAKNEQIHSLQQQVEYLLNINKQRATENEQLQLKISYDNNMIAANKMHFARPSQQVIENSNSISSCMLIIQKQQTIIDMLSAQLATSLNRAVNSKNFKERSHSNISNISNNQNQKNGNLRMENERLRADKIGLVEIMNEQRAESSLLAEQVIVLQTKIDEIFTHLQDKNKLSQQY